MRERGFAVKTAIMDKGYDNGPIHDGCMDRHVAPVTALRETDRVKRGEHKPPCWEHGTWTFAVTDYKRKATKWRCKAIAGVYRRHVSVRDRSTQCVMFTHERDGARPRGDRIEALGQRHPDHGADRVTRT
ncbi:MAG: hypothetical protein M3459_05820 [Actinomycetota bacterium]|nr:hypothetical protein [Actinomycetota bacterium]